MQKLPHTRFFIAVEASSRHDLTMPTCTWNIEIEYQICNVTQTCKWTEGENSSALLSERGRGLGNFTGPIINRGRSFADTAWPGHMSDIIYRGMF